MKMKKFNDLNQYDFSGYAEEITGDALFKINGGAEIENSNKGVANAKPGDTLTRNDGTTVTITQGDIDWAKKQVGESETTATSSTPTSVTETSNSQQQQNTSSTTETGKTNTTTKSGNNSTSAVSSTGTKVPDIQETADTVEQTISSTRTSSEYHGVGPQYWDTLDEQKSKKQDSVSLKYDPYDSSRVIVDLDDKTAMQQAADLLSEASLGFRVTAYGSESGITKEFKNYSEINDYLIVNANNEKKDDFSYSFSIGAKAALIFGVGVELGVIKDNSRNWYFYVSGSIGCGIQTPTTLKTDLSIQQYLTKAIGTTPNIKLDSTQAGTSTSLTADICLGLSGVYDLENLNTSGLPNSWGFGSIGGGVWKTGTFVTPLNTER